MGRKFFAFLLSFIISIQFVIFPGNSLSEECRTGFQRGNLARTGCYPDSCAPATDEVSLDWSYQADSSSSASTNIAPVALDNMVFFTTNNNTFTGRVLAINPQNGAIVWETNTPSVNQFTVAGGRVIALCNEELRSINYSDGSTAWKISDFYTDDPYYQTIGSPLVNSGKIYVALNHGHIYCLDFADGKKIWECKLDKLDTLHSVSEGKIFVGSSRYIYCIDQFKGTKIWDSLLDFSFPPNSTLAIEQGKIYTIGIDENSSKFSLYCLSIDKCKKIFAVPISENKVQNPVVANGKVYLGTKDGGIQCLQADTGKLVWKKTYSGSILNSPTVSNGKLFFVAGENLVVASCTDGNVLYEEEVGAKPGIDIVPSMGKLFAVTKDSRLLSFDSPGKTNIKKSSINFGFLEPKKAIPKDIEIKNNGDENIEMTAVKTGPIKLSSEKFTVAPKSSYKLTATPNLDLAKLGQSNGEIVLSWGDSSKKIPFTFCKTAGDSFTYANDRNNIEGKKYVPANQLPKRNTLKRMWYGITKTYWNGFFYTFGYNGIVSILEPQNGKTILEEGFGREIKEIYFDGGKMFLEIDYGIICIDPLTLRKAWRWDQSRRMAQEAICASAGKIAIESDSHYGNIFIDILDQKTGKILHNIEVDYQKRGFHYGLAIRDNLVYFNADRLYCFNTDTGKVVWKTGTECQEPFIMREGVICNATETGKKETFVRCSDPGTGKKLWLFEGNLICAGNKRVVSEKKGQLSCLDASNGKLLWSKPLNDNALESVMIMGDSVVMSNGKKMLYFDISSGNLTGSSEMVGIPVCAGGGMIFTKDLDNTENRYTSYCYGDFDSVEIDTPSLDFGTKLSKLSFELTNYTGKTKNITAEADDGSISFKPDQFSLEPEKKIQIEATIGRVDTTPGAKVVPVKIKWDDGLICLNAISYKDAGLPSWPNEDGDGGGRTPTSSNLNMGKLSLLWKYKPEEGYKDEYGLLERAVEEGSQFPSGAVCGDGKLFVFDKQFENPSRKIRYLKCFDISNGKLLWKKEFYYSDVSWFEGKLYVKSDNGLICMLGETGETLWNKFIPNISSLTLYDGLLYSKDGCYDTKDGEKLWESKGREFVVGDGKYFSYYYSYDYDSNKIKKLACLDARTGKKIWENDASKLDAIFRNFLCTNGVLVYFYGHMQGVDTSTGKILWTIKDPFPSEIKSINAANGLIVISSHIQGDVYSNRKRFFPQYDINIFSAKTGKKIRELHFEETSNPMIARDKVYFLSAMHLLGFSTNSDSIRENYSDWKLWSAGGFGAITCVGDKLFVSKSDGNVYCYSSGDGFLLDENFYDFRTVAPGTKKDIWATIENLSKNQVKTTIEVTTPSVTAETSELTFEPGEKKKLKLTMDLSGSTSPENGKVLRGELVIRWPGPEKRFQLRGYVENKKPEMACTDSFLENELNQLFIYPEACGPKKNLKKVMAWPDAYLTKDKVVALNNGALENYSLDGLKKTIFIKSPECKTLGTPDHEGAFYVADGKQVHKYDETRGKKLWTAKNFKMDEEMIVDEIYCYKGKVFVFVGNLYCLDSKTGKTIWMAQTKRKESKNYPYSYDRDEGLIFQMAFDSNRAYLCRLEDRRTGDYENPRTGFSFVLSCFDIANGKVFWEQNFFDSDIDQSVFGDFGFASKSIINNIFIKNGIIYLQVEAYSHGIQWDGLCSFNMSNGKKIIEVPYTCDASSVSDGKLRCENMFIDIETGECIWEDKSYMNCHARSGDYAYAKNSFFLDSLYFHDGDLEIYNTLTNTKTGSFDFCFDGSSDNKTSYISRRSFVVPIKDYLFVVREPNLLYCFSEGATKKLEFQIGSSKFKADGAEQDMGVKLQTIGGVTYLPAKFVAEPMGGDTLWNDRWKEITVILNGNTIRMRIGYEKATVNANDIQIDPKNPKVVPIISGGRTLVPMRFLAENLGCKLDYDQKTKKITITSGVK